MSVPFPTGLLFIAALGAVACRSASEPRETSAASEKPAIAAQKSPATATTTTPLAQRLPNSAAAITSIIETIPAYPGAVPSTSPPWSSPSELGAGQWGSQWAAHTSDDGRKVLDWYVQALQALGWTNSPAFASMESFEKKVGGARKLLTVASSPDGQKSPAGKTLIRVLVQDND